MNAHALPYAFVPGTPSAVRAPRDVEYDVFSRVTAALKQAHTNNDAIGLTAAVHKNTNLWNTLLADLMSPGNRLPEGLRADIAALGLFSVQHGFRVMSGGAPVAPLIDVNIAIMRGLRGEATT